VAEAADATAAAADDDDEEDGDDDEGEMMKKNRMEMEMEMEMEQWNLVAPPIIQAELCCVFVFLQRSYGSSDACREAMEALMPAIKLWKL
jgi:hypothetical protein